MLSHFLYWDGTTQLCGYPGWHFIAVLRNCWWITELGQVLWKNGFLSPQLWSAKCQTFLSVAQWQEATGKNWNTANSFKRKKRLFTVKAVKHWSWMPREVFSLHPWKYSNTTRQGLEQPALVHPIWAQGLDYMVSRDAFQTILSFCKECRIECRILHGM